MRLLAALALALCAPAAHAQTFAIERAQAPETPGEIGLGIPAATGTPPESWHRLNGELGVRNVSVATLTPFLPPADANTGAAVVVAPGGAFLGLAIDAEGWRVARWLADHGIAAFVLKYRTLPTPADFDTFRREMIAVRTGKGTASFRPPASTPPAALADGLAAMKLVRANAAKWGVDPRRVGMMGFSAGAFTTLSVTLADDAAATPAFIAPIYGPLDAVTVPKGAPPMYAVIAADDGLFWRGNAPLIESWWKAGAPVEFHLHQKGGHGFGLGAAGTTTIDWMDGFRRWLDVNGFFRSKP